MLQITSIYIFTYVLCVCVYVSVQRSCKRLAVEVNQTFMVHKVKPAISITGIYSLILPSKNLRRKSPGKSESFRNHLTMDSFLSED